MCGEDNLLTRLTGYLAHPSLDLPHNLYADGVNEQTLLKTFFLLRANKVLFRVLNSGGSHGFLEKSKAVAELVRESVLFEDSYDYMRSQKRELLDVVAKFNEKSVDSVFIKSLNDLPLDSDNFDILVRKEDLPVLFKVLKDCGFVEVTWVREPYKWLFRRVEGAKGYTAIHLHTAVAWGGIEFVDVKDLWKKHRKKEVEGVTLGLPSPEHHLLTTVAHAFFENRQFSLGDLAYLIEDMKDGSVDWEYVANWTVRNRWFDSFSGMMRLADYVHEELFESPLIPVDTRELIARKTESDGRDLAERLIAQFDERRFLPVKVSTTIVGFRYVRKVLTDADLSFSDKSAMILHLFDGFVKKRIPLFKRHPAFLVCFVGRDGTGKTTHAKYVWKEVTQVSKTIRVKYVWSRGFGHFLHPFLVVVRRLLLDSGAPKISQRSNASRRASVLKREPMKSLWAYVMITDHLLHLARVRLALGLGYLVICDRWIIDTIVDVKCDLGKTLGRFLEAIIEGLAPNPDFTFIMDTETSRLIERRLNVDNDLLEHKRQSYLEYSRRKNSKVINTNEALEENRKKIASVVVRNFLSKTE